MGTSQHSSARPNSGHDLILAATARLLMSRRAVITPWMLLCLMPIVGALILLIMLRTDSDPGDNRFGETQSAPASAERRHVAAVG